MVSEDWFGKCNKIKHHVMEPYEMFLREIFTIMIINILIVTNLWHPCGNFSQYFFKIKLMSYIDNVHVEFMWHFHRHWKKVMQSTSYQNSLNLLCDRHAIWYFPNPLSIHLQFDLHYVTSRQGIGEYLTQ